MNEIRPQYTHSKAGTLMFNLCAKWTKFLVKHKWLYYLLACTWGVLMTLAGLFITICLAIAKLFNKNITFHSFNWIYYIKVGPRFWGGFDCGLMFIRDYGSDDDYLNCHEWGHTFQNCLFGPLMLFIVVIPSAIRWWKLQYGKLFEDYDAAWFEDAATQCGQYANKYLKK